MRRCPHKGCKMMVPDGIFACRQHWASMSKPHKDRIYECYQDYTKGKIGVEELRQKQAAVMEEIQGPDTEREQEQFAINVKVFLKELDTFLRTKEQLAEKQKLLVAIQRKRRELIEQADALIHPTQVQPSLFENPPETRLPESTR